MNTNTPSSDPGRQPEARRRKTALAVLGVMIALLSLGAIVTVATQHAVGQTRGSSTNAAKTARLPANDPAFDYATGLSKVFRNAANTVLPSVVTIQRTAAVQQQAKAPPGDKGGDTRDREKQPFGDLFNDPLFKRFFGDNAPGMPQLPLPEVPQGPQMSLGSGVIIDSGGVVLTNNHVVDGGGRIVVRLHDGREFEATEVKTDPRTDLAVIRIRGGGKLPAARWGDSDQLEVGDWVIAVGNPFGLNGTVTAGIISAKGRGIGITPREEFLQTDAAINPGNSGGPLVNLRGEVVGINTAISSRTGGYQGIGFAIPTNLAKWVSTQLVEHGVVQRAYLGVGIQKVTPELARQFGLKNNSGVVVTEVHAGSPAADAGVKAGDVVVSFGDHAIHNPREIQAYVEQSPAGTKQPLVVVRDGNRMTLNVTVRRQPKDYGVAGKKSSDKGSRHRESFEQLGMGVSNLTPDVAEKLGLKDAKGVVITSVKNGSPADLAGLRSTMVIERVGQQPVQNLDDFRAAIKDQSLAKGVLLLVRGEGGSRFVVIKGSQK